MEEISNFIKTIMEKTSKKVVLNKSSLDSHQNQMLIYILVTLERSSTTLNSLKLSVVTPILDLMILTQLMKVRNTSKPSLMILNG